MDEQVRLFLEAKGNTKLVAGVPMRLLESQKLRFFWKEFGLNKYELASCSPQWLEDMWLVHLGIEKAKSNLAQQGSNSRASGNFKNKRVEKLL